MQEKQPQEKVNNERKYKVIGVLLALVLPAAVIIVTIVLASRNVNITNTLKEGLNIAGKEEALGAEDEIEETYSVFAKELKPVFADAARLKIPSVSIDIPLIEVGVEDDGTMETPDNWQEGGWYSKSGMPGEGKNVIVNAHYDTNYGAPAAFYNLRNLQEGEKVEIVDGYGRIFTYNVVKSTYLDIKDPSRLDVLEDEEGKSTLTLITCGGVWLPGSGYNKRLVVQAELQGQTQAGSI